MKQYRTLSETINDLKKRGYNEDLNLKATCIECPGRKLQLNPEDFTINEFYRFEGMSNPSDNSIVYAISSKAGIKGVLVDAYGVYAENLNDAMIKKLKGGNYELTGDMTIHGTTKQIKVNMLYRGTTANPNANGAPVAGIQITGTIKRSDFGVGPGFPPPMISDEVRIKADGEFGHKK